MQRRLGGMRALRRVRVVPDRSARGIGAQHPLHVLRAVHPLQLLHRRRRRLHLLHEVEQAAQAQPVLDRRQPLRRFGVTRPHLVPQRRGMADPGNRAERDHNFSSDRRCKLAHSR